MIPRKTPRQARAQATVLAILEATAHILREGGLTGISTNAIAARAGVSIGSLYQYFPSKEAVLAELLRAKRAALLGKFEAELARQISSNLMDLAVGLVDAALDDQFGDARLALALEYVEATLPVHKETLQFKQSLVDRFADALASRGIADPETAAVDLVAIGRAMIDGAALRGESNVADVRARTLRAIVGYLKS